MNIVRGMVERTAAGALAVRVGTCRIELGEHHLRWPDLDRRVGDWIAVGIRPESFLADDQGDLMVEVTEVEWVGAEQFVHATLGARPVRAHGGEVSVADEPTTTIVAAISSDYRVDLWHPVHLGVRVDELHLFELRTGRAIRRVDTPAAAWC
jgi:ABC-type sugar transport system ATPase subunit